MVDFDESLNAENVASRKVAPSMAEGTTLVRLACPIRLDLKPQTILQASSYFADAASLLFGAELATANHHA